MCQVQAFRTSGTSTDIRHWRKLLLPCRYQQQYLAMPDPQAAKICQSFRKHCSVAQGVWLGANQLRGWRSGIYSSGVIFLPLQSQAILPYGHE
jgi:hypothetical protein